MKRASALVLYLISMSAFAENLSLKFGACTLDLNDRNGFVDIDLRSGEKQINLKDSLSPFEFTSSHISPMRILNDYMDEMENSGARESLLMEINDGAKKSLRLETLIFKHYLIKLSVHAANEDKWIAFDYNRNLEKIEAVHGFSKVDESLISCPAGLK